MIKNFETETAPMTYEELKLAEILASILKTVSKNNPINGKTICKKMNHPEMTRLTGVKTVLTEPRLRKIVNYIRANKILPVLSNNSGYYVSYDKEDIRQNIESLRDRADAILYSAEGLEKFIK